MHRYEITDYDGNILTHVLAPHHHQHNPYSTVLPVSARTAKRVVALIGERVAYTTVGGRTVKVQFGRCPQCGTC